MNLTNSYYLGILHFLAVGFLWSKPSSNLISSLIRTKNIYTFIIMKTRENAEKNIIKSQCSLRKKVFSREALRVINRKKFRVNWIPIRIPHVFI